MKYLLDTNILSYLSDKSSPFHQNVKERLSQLANEDEVFISVLTVYELEYSVSLSNPDQKDRLKKLVTSFKQRFSVVPITDRGARVFGELKSQYRKNSGSKKNNLDQHNIDFIIASCALSENFVLISNDGIFKQIQALTADFKTENWAS